MTHPTYHHMPVLEADTSASVLADFQNHTAFELQGVGGTLCYVLAGDMADALDCAFDEGFMNYYKLDGEQLAEYEEGNFEAICLGNEGTPCYIQEYFHCAVLPEATRLALQAILDAHYEVAEDSQ